MSLEPHRRVVRASAAPPPEDAVVVAEVDGPFGALDALDRLAARGAPADAVILEDTGDPAHRRALEALFVERHPGVSILFERPGRFRRAPGG